MCLCEDGFFVSLFLLIVQQTKELKGSKDGEEGWRVVGSVEVEWRGGWVGRCACTHGCRTSSGTVAARMQGGSIDTLGAARSKAKSESLAAGEECGA